MKQPIAVVAIAALTIGVTVSFLNRDFFTMYIFLAWGILLAVRFRYGPGMRPQQVAPSSIERTGRSSGAWRLAAGFFLTVAGLCGVAYAVVNNAFVLIIPCLPVYALGHWLRHQAREQRSETRETER